MMTSYSDLVFTGDQDICGLLYQSSLCFFPRQDPTTPSAAEPTTHLQMNRLFKKIEREKIMMSTMPELSLQILEYAREHGRVTIGTMVKLTGVSRNTLKEHFRQLHEKGHLSMHGSGRSTWYALL